MYLDLISPNLEKEKKTNIPSFGWKLDPTLVENSTTYRLGIDQGWQWIPLP